MELLIWTWVSLPVVFLGVILAMYVRERRLRHRNRGLVDQVRSLSRRFDDDQKRFMAFAERSAEDAAVIRDLRDRVRRQDASMRTLKAWNTRYRETIASLTDKGVR